MTNNNSTLSNVEKDTVDTGAAHFVRFYKKLIEGGVPEDLAAAILIAGIEGGSK